MSKADLHIHSKYSEHLSEEFLRKMGAAESYTEPEFIYRTAKERGMTYVTITDHNKIDGVLALQAKYPAEVFTGVEATTYFPEDGYRVHALIYGLTAADFEEVQRARKSIYDLRDLIKERGLAHSIAHATYSGNDKLSIEKLEKLILLFDVFEGINGGSSKICNRTWIEILSGLTPGKIDELYRRHRIEPFSSDPWIKGITGGSDDHSGLYLGRTYTVADTRNAGEFLESLKAKKTAAEGRHSDFQSLVFTLYKIGYDFSKSKSRKHSNSSLSRISDLIFENRPLRLRDKLAIRTLKYQNRRKADRAKRMMIDLIDEFRREGNLPIEEKLDRMYDTVADMSDELIRIFLKSLAQDIQKGNLLTVVRNISSAFTSLLLALPFFATFKHMYKGRRLIEDLNAQWGKGRSEKDRKVLWFTDTLNDLSGFSFTSHFQSKMLKIASPLKPGEMNKAIAPFMLDMPLVYEMQLPNTEQFTLRIPSLLKSIRAIYAYDPDEVYISTHGPVGLFGLLIARLLNIKSVGVYHTDFYQAQISEVLRDKSGASMYESYVRWFYSLIDEIRLPDSQQMDTFENLGLDRSKMRIFYGDLDPAIIASQPSSLDTATAKEV